MFDFGDLCWIFVQFLGVVVGCEYDCGGIVGNWCNVVVLQWIGKKWLCQQFFDGDWWFYGIYLVSVGEGIECYLCYLFVGLFVGVQF